MQWFLVRILRCG